VPKEEEENKMQNVDFAEDDELDDKYSNLVIELDKY